MGTAIDDMKRQRLSTISCLHNNFDILTVLHSEISPNYSLKDGADLDYDDTQDSVALSSAQWDTWVGARHATFDCSHVLCQVLLFRTW